MKFTHSVILAAPYCGETDWGCLSQKHAENLADDLRGRGCTVVAIRERKA